jgi:hypothetical protein
MMLITLTWLKLDEKQLELVIVDMSPLFICSLWMSRNWPLGHVGSVLLSIVT